MEKQTILIVDDEEINRAVLSITFGDDFQILEAADGREALACIDAHPGEIVAVLLDVVMPVMDGFEVLRILGERKMLEQLPVFLITAENSEERLRLGYDLGAVDIIEKPIVPYFIRRRIGNVIQLNNLVRTQDQMLAAQAKEILDLNSSILETLATAIEFRDQESGEHVRRIRQLTLLLLEVLMERYPEKYCFDEEELRLIADAAVMHDLGKIAIPDSILNKPGRLTPEEFEIMKTHTTQGCVLLDNVPRLRENPVYAYAYDICRHHHERWDGRGYPDHLKAGEITIWAQVVALADVYDALVGERVYKKAFSHEKAVSMILNGECGMFNPELMDCLTFAQDRIYGMYHKRSGEEPVQP